MTSDLMNPIKLIEFVFKFAKGIIDFMNSEIQIPNLGYMPIWSLFVSALAPLLLYIVVKRLFL